MICVDPRFTRSAAKAHIYAPLRSGTDIAFLGGMIKYILDNDLIQKEYVVEYTNVSFLIDEKFGFEDGLFTGYDPKGRKYDRSTWKYQLDAQGLPKTDKTLQNPHCVYQLLKKHYSRYNLDIVSQTPGTPKEDLLKVYKAFAATGKPDKVGTILYAMDWTQHTVGTQNIRAMSIIQLLLGNIGLAGGGVNALRGESNVVVKAGQQVPSFAFLQDDGSTTCGNWLYCGSYKEAGNMAARRGKADPTGIGLYSGWAWCWPVNRRIIYNRASVNWEGKPWDPKRAVIWWDGNKWVGDVPDGPPPPGATFPFIMLPEGHARIFGLGMAEGPFPEHYEPLECPIEKNLLSSQKFNPTAKLFGEPGIGAGADKYLSCDPRFPLVCTAYRVTEHWQTGVMTRWTPWLLELEPQMFVEMSKELAKEKGIKNGERVVVKSARGEVEAKAIVTDRFKPFKIAGQIVHQVGLPWHFGWVTPPDGGDSANLRTPTIGDANTMIPESKAFMVNVEKKGGK